MNIGSATALFFIAAGDILSTVGPVYCLITLAPFPKAVELDILLLLLSLSPIIAPDP